MIFELLDSKGISEWVDLVLFFINLLKIDVTSINDLSNKMIAMQNMFGSLMGLEFLYLSYGSSAVTIQ